MIENPTTEQLKTLTRIIYLIRNKINGMPYVGQARFTFYRRYTKGNWFSRPSNIYFKNSVKKYGKENFEVIILEHDIPDDDNWLNELEVYYIKKYNCLYPSGYNFDEGGQSLGKRTHPIIREKLSLVKRINTKWHILVDSLGNHYSFHNISRFAREHNLILGSLYFVLNGKMIQTGGFRLPDTPLELRNRSIGNNGLCKLKKNKTIYEFYDTKKFCKEHNIPIKTAHRILRGYTKQSYDGWTLPENEFNPKEVLIKKWKEVIFIKDGIEYKTNNISEFSRNNNLYPSNFSKLINKKRKTCNGFSLKEVIY